MSVARPPQSDEQRHVAERHARGEAKISQLWDDHKAAVACGDLKAAERAFHELRLHSLWSLAEMRTASIEADTLAVELSLYRPTRASEKAAPIVPDHCYVTTSGPWVCVAREIVKTAVYKGFFTSQGSFTQEHCVPDVKTLCGKKNVYPVSERFESGGWPRLRELCPECCGIIDTRA